MNSVIIVGCFTPLIIIWIIMKLSLWVSAINDEKRYIRNESKKQHGPYLDNPYADVDEEEEEHGSRTDYR